MKDKEIKQLFFLQRDITMGVRDGLLVFLNAAGRERFPDLKEGDSVRSTLSKDVLAMEEARFVASVSIGTTPHTVLATCVGDMQIYTLIPQEEPNARERLLLENLSTSMRRTLTVLSMATELLSPFVFQMEDSRQRDNMTAINKTYYQLERLCDNLDHFSRLQEGEGRLRLENMDIVQFCRDLIQSADHLTKKLDVRFHFQTSVPRLIMAIDDRKMSKLLLGLISNSLGRMERGGSVSLDLTARGEDLILVLKDTGPGIPPEAIPHIFERHRREQSARDPQTGVGFGLPIAREIAQLHGGSLLLTNRKNQGTAVCLHLPIRRVESEGCLEETPLPYGQGNDGMHGVLVELVDVLDDEIFGLRYLD